MDGRFVDWDDATVHVLTPTLHYGWGVFEGIRAYPTERGPAVFRLTDHIARLFRSAHIYLMEPAFTPAEFVAAVKELVRVNELEAGYIRPLLYLGYGEMGLNPLPSPTKAAIACWPWGAYLGEEAAHNGVRVMVSSFERISHNSLPPAAKTTGQYINSSLAKVQALKAGYDEAILLTPQGYIAEGPGENVFAVYDKRIVTPPLLDGVLAGLTRDSVMTIARDEGYEVIERSLTRADLYVADEAWFTGTAAEMVPIVEIDDRRIGTGRPGPVATQLLELYGQAVRGQLDRYKDWCEYVTE
jgi:branched-chain amino acid aminotransferase